MAQKMPAYWYCKKECWITSGGSDIVELMRDMDKKSASVAPIGENKLPHQLETFDFVAMYPNIPVSCMKRVMKELLELVFTYEQVIYGYKIHIREIRVQK